MKYLMSFYDGFEAWKAEKAKKLAQLPADVLALAKALDARFRPFVNHIVKMKQPCGANAREAFEARARCVIEAGLNSFYFPANMLDTDFLSDSGTSAMSAE